MKLKLQILFIILLLGNNTLVAQNNRINTHNTIAWIGNFATIPLHKKWSLHAEYQWRRVDVLNNWQQGLLRLGINYQARPTILIRAGYALAETFAYGEYPINGFGKAFTEHRTYQMLQLTQRESKVEINHRFMLEQRFVGKYNSAVANTEDEYPLLHRMRYLVRATLPLGAKNTTSIKPYLSAYNEVFVGFGKNVNANVFDQNRTSVLVGYKINKAIKVEAGYLNQILQYGRQINGKNIFQYNNGLILNAYYNLLSK
jgi:hypothetical protein